MFGFCSRKILKEILIFFFVYRDFKIVISINKFLLLKINVFNRNLIFFVWEGKVEWKRFEFFFEII